MSPEKKSHGGAESQTLLMILAYKVKEGHREGGGTTSKEEKEQREMKKMELKTLTEIDKGKRTKGKRKKLQG